MAIIAGNQVEITDSSDGYSIFLSQESHVWQGDTQGVSENQSTTVTITGYQGNEKITCTIESAIAAPTGITVTNDGKTPSPTLTITATTACKTSGSITIPITINQGDIVIEKLFTYSIASQGADGQQGSDGKGIANVETYFLASPNANNVTASTPGWSTDSNVKPTSDKPYLWIYEKITYTYGDPTMTAPRIIGYFSSDGRGVDSIVKHYLVCPDSTGITRADPRWSTTVPVITATDKYLWSYETINYSDGDSMDTDPVIVGAYGDMPETPYTLDITSSKGNYFKTKDQSTVLTAVVFRGDSRLTDLAINKEGRVEWWDATANTKITEGLTYTVPKVNDVLNFEAKLIMKDTMVALGRISLAYIEDGIDGQTSYIHIKYSGVPDPTDASQIGDTPDKYMGTYLSFDAEAPVDPTLYTWTRIQGDGSKSIASTQNYFLISDKSEGVTVWETTENLFGDKALVTAENMKNWEPRDASAITDVEDGVVCYRVNMFDEVTWESGFRGLRTDFGKIQQGHRYRYSFSIKSKLPVNEYLYDHFWLRDRAATGNHYHSDSICNTYDIPANTWTHIESTFTATKADCEFVCFIIDFPAGDTFWVKDFKVQEWGSNDAGWSVAPMEPTDEKPYLWSYTRTEFSDASVEIVPPHIIGTRGKDGLAGKTAYMHVKYAPNNHPTADQMSEDPNVYMGTYVDYNEQDPTDPDLYTWVKVMGDDGQDGISVTGVKEYYGLSANPQNKPTNWSLTPQTPTSELPYHWSYTETSFSDNHTDESQPRIIGTFGVTGKDGTSVTGVQEHYAVNNSSTNPPTSWQNTPPQTSETNRYLWNYETFTFSNGSTQDTNKRVIGTFAKDGQDGTAGKDAVDGKTSYFHVKYSPVANPTASQMTEVPDNFIGTYVDFEQQDSSDPTKYVWSQFKGDPGENGINGTNGEDGTTHYLHIAYATSADGRTGFSTTDATNKTYLGTYQDETEADSTDPTKYKWSLIKGADGRGITKTENFYLLSASETGVTTSTTGWSTSFSNPTEDKPYLWSYEKTTYTSNETYSTTPFILVRFAKDGEDGTNGRGIAKIEEYYLVSPNNSGITTSTAGWTTTPQTPNVTNKYLWNYEKITYDNGDVVSLTPKIISNFAKDGEDGEDGNSITGVTNYYLVSPKNTGITIAGNTWSTTPPQMTSTNKYLWNYEVISYSKNGSETSTPCVIGVYGDQGIPGTNGTNGQTSYFHVKFAPVKNPTANQMTETPDVYIGTYVDFTATDSTDPSKYTWSQFKGDPGENGINGTNGEDGKTYYLHIAYADSADGKTGFSTTNSVNKLYMGVYSDTNQTDSTDATKYKWSLIKGDEGNGISKTENFYLTTNAGTGVTTSTSGWSTTITNPTADKKYLWNYEKITYTDNSTYYSNPHIVTTFVQDGKDGANGRGISSITEYYLASPNNTGITTSSSGWSTVVPQMTETNKYLWNYEKITYTDNTSENKTPVVIGHYGKDGADGTNGVSVTNVQEHYAISNSSTTAPTLWQNTPPATSETNRYLWNYETFSYSNGNTQDTQKRVIGTFAKDGKDGTPGTKGTDGQTSYFHVKYSSVAKPTSSSQMTETPSDYIGTYVDFTQADSNDPSKYTWTQFKGDPGNDGINGTNGINGKTYYLHIAYADSVDGKTGFSTTNSENKKYLGTCSDETQADPTDPTRYSWSLFKGADGQDGENGVDGNSVTGVTNYYLVSPNKTGITTSSSGWSTTPQQMTATNKYLWNYEVITYSKAASQTSTPCVIGVYGDQGVAGKDAVDGKTSYFHVKYSAVANPTSSSQMTETPSTYIGTYVDFEANDSTDPSKYTWSQFKGDKGEQGIAGTNGTNGKTYYLHIAYANSADGKTGFSVSDATNKAYMGVYQDEIELDSTDATKYTWSLIKGSDGNGISKTENFYLTNNSSSGVTTSTSGWTTTITTPSASAKYLWNYEKVTYTNGSTYNTDPHIVTMYAEDGKDGVAGRGITSIEEYYLASPNNTGVTTSTSGWSTTCPTTNSTNKYLWNYEKITYSDGTSESKTPKVIGNFAENGKDGAKGDQGISISSIVTYYLTTTNDTAPAVSDSKWSTTYPTLSSTNKYLWSYTKTTLSNNTSSSSAPVLIGTYSVDGKSVSAITTQYYVSTSKTSQTGGSWVSTQPNWEAGKYLWIRQKVDYTNPTSTSYTTPYVDSAWEKVTEINNKIDNLQIGGRNLIKNSVFSQEFDKWIQSTGTYVFGDGTTAGEKCLIFTPTGGEKRIYQMTSNVWVKDQVYAYSFWAKSDVANTTIEMTRSLVDSGGKHIITNEWKRYTGTIKSTATANEGTLSIVFSDKASITRIKLEIGNVPTDWTPNPDDVNENVQDVITRMTAAESEINQTKEQIEMKVSREELTQVKDEVGSANTGGTNLLRGTREFIFDDSQVRGFKNEAMIQSFKDEADEQFTYIQFVDSGNDDVDSECLLSSQIPVSHPFKYTFSMLVMTPAVADLSSKDIARFELVDDKGNIVSTQTMNLNADNISLTDNAWTRVYKTFSLPSDVSFSYGQIRLNTQATGTIYYEQLKVEQGSTATEWSPNPADLSERFSDYLTAEDTTTLIHNESSSITQTYDQIVLELRETTQTIQSDLSTEVTERRDYLRFDEVGLWLGKSDSNVQLLLQNSRMCFVENDDYENPPMYIESHQINIDQLSVKNELNMTPLVFKNLGSNKWEIR